MKKNLIIPLIIIILLSIMVGCTNNKTENAVNNNEIINQKDKETYTLGDTVETDILKFRLIAGEYTYALVNITNNDNFGKPKEYEGLKDNLNPYVAGKGHTYASFTFYIENLDRSSVDVSSSFNKRFTSVKYDNIKHNDYAKFVAESSDSLNWNPYSSSNILLLAGVKKYYRSYIDIPIDVYSLDDTLELTIYLPTSNGKTKSFKYVISEEDRKNYKGEEISLNTAIKNFERKEAKEYFEKRIDEYSVLNGNEIKNIFEGNKFNVCISPNGGAWKGTFLFEESGRIFEGGNEYAYAYMNKRKWSVSGDKLMLSSGSYDTPNYNSCEVRKIKDDVYILICEEKLYGTLYK